MRKATLGKTSLLLMIPILFLSVTISSASQLAAKRQGTALGLKEVYADRNFAPDSWELVGPDVSFSPDGQEIYVIDSAKSEVVVLDWKKNQTVRRMDYKKQLAEIGMPEGNGCGFLTWQYLPETQHAVMIFCQTPFLVDRMSLEIYKKLPSSVGPLRPQELEFSTERGYLVVYWENRMTREHFIRVYKVENWSVVAEWNFKDWEVVAEWAAKKLRHIALTPDGRYLVSISYGCQGEFREIPSGAVVSSWQMKRGKNDGCAREQPAFLPGNEYIFASKFTPNSVPPSRIGFWDARSGTMVKQIVDKRDIAFLGNWTLSRNGRWIAASVRDRRKYSRRFQQDFKIWDVRTGRLVFETARERWRRSKMRRQASSLYLRFSPDSRYLLTLSYKELAIYEIIEKS